LAEEKETGKGKGRGLRRDHKRAETERDISSKHGSQLRPKKKNEKERVEPSTKGLRGTNHWELHKDQTKLSNHVQRDRGVPE